MGAPNVLLTDLSPDTVRRLTSIVATILGIALFLTRGSIGFLVRCFRAAFRRPQRAAGASEPHFHSRRAMLAEETWE
jgi:hypothetical protein